MRRAAVRLHGDNLIEDLPNSSREKGSSVNHHVDLVSARTDRVSNVQQLDVQRGAARGKRRGHGSDFHARALEDVFRVFDQVGVDADRCGARHAVVGGIGSASFRAERGHPSRRVRPFERREVHHGNGEIESGQFRRLFERASAQFGRARFGADRVNPGESAEQGTELSFGLHHRTRSAGGHAYPTFVGGDEAKGGDTHVVRLPMTYRESFSRISRQTSVVALPTGAA